MASALTNGLTNGVNGLSHGTYEIGAERFSNIPDAIDITVGEEGEGEAVEVDLVELLDDPTELCTLLENESVHRSYWMIIALAYAKKRKPDLAIEIVQKALGTLKGGNPEEKLSLQCCLCWMYMSKCREAPRVKPEGQAASEAKTKDFYIHSATSTLNDAGRINPSHPPLFLARGVLLLLKASLQNPTKAGVGQQDNLDRIDTLKQALKCFDDALRMSNGKNLMAVLGKARVQFSHGKFGEALQNYQSVLERAPQLIDPDPRIGIGCCLWNLGHKDGARSAWERSLELNPDSATAVILLALYTLHQSSQYLPADPEWKPLYRKAMMQYTQTAFKLNDHKPLTCSTFATHFLMERKFETAEKLARRAIDLTDVNAIASDGWYALARKEHYQEDTAKAAEYYLKSDQARGGDDRGFPPAKFGGAQIRVLMNEYDGAKFRLEKIVQQSKSIEAMTLLGTLHAEDVFNAQVNGLKEDKANEAKKAIGLLETVRMAWKDPKRKISPDSTVLLNLARLYEVDAPEKSLECLQQVEQMELDDIPEEDRPDGLEDQELKKALREQLAPQLLNNMACFHYQAGRFEEARNLFEIALNACVKAGEKDSSLDTDALVTTVSYNFARTYEAEGKLDEAKQIYTSLIARHEGYTDANTRLAYINLRQNPTDEGPRAVQELFQAAPGNMEVRALYGHYLSKSKRRTTNIAEDQEQRHYKHTLLNYDKHDRYALTAMGNIYLTLAREMRRETSEERGKRSKTYDRAVEFFEKALQLDPKNAYAAQGIAIAMIEDKKNYSGAVQELTKIKVTLKDSNVLINLGHAYCELKQYSRAIENYDAALLKDKQNDPQLLACLGRVWLLRGKQDNKIDHMRSSLEYSKQALGVAPEQIHFKFNVAFVQFLIAQTLVNVPEAQRTLEEVQTALDDLNTSIESLFAIAKAPNPPFPRSDIESRATMGKNTITKQLQRTLQSQKEYEEKNADRLAKARGIREAEQKKREEERRKIEAEAAEARRKIAEERHRLAERDRELIKMRAEEERRAAEAEMTTDSETGEKKKREKRKKAPKRKKKGEESDDEDDGVASEGGPGGEGAPRKAKKRRLGRKTERRAKQSAKQSKSKSKFKSSEMIEDSDEDEDEAIQEMKNNAALASKLNDTSDVPDSPMPDDDDEEEGVAAKVPSKPRRSNRAVIDDEEDDDETAAATDAPSGKGKNGAASDSETLGDGADGNGAKKTRPSESN